MQPFNLEGVELLSPRLFRIIFFHLVDFDFEIETMFCCVCVCVFVYILVKIYYKSKANMPMAIIDTVFKYSKAAFNANFIQL